MSFDPNPNNPYAASTQPVAPKKSNVLLYVMLGIGGALVAICCGCGGMGYFAFQKGIQQAATAVRPQLQADPAVMEHIGNLDTVSVDMGGLMSEVQKNPQRHQGRNMAFKVKGDKGQGIVIGRLDQQGAGQARIGEGELIMPSGEMFPLTP